METFYFLLVVFLLCLAVFDLMVGVSNDAVNFINSSVGSKAAPLKVILMVAGLGILVGATLSNGMIDIARNGIFNPENFVFSDIMCIFVAAMITDVFLLDFFNTLGLPTSTTVSFVFELLGAAFAISMLMIINDPTGSLQFVELLNTEKALAIISGIFLSVALAFICGSIIQFIVRLIFTFNFKKNLKYFAAVYGGLAVTAIIYFMLIKGLKNSSFISSSQMAEISRFTPMILLGCFAFFTVLMEILYLLKVNVLKVVVLFGTFALALAFASNDLVNFIGVPLAGLESYLHYIASGGGDLAKTLTMETLKGPSQTPFYFLLIAAVVMLIALLTSKKAHNVVKTELNLAKQDESEDIFNSSVMGRNLVRGMHKMTKSFDKVIPDKVTIWINKRFDKADLTLEDGASFDLLRASVNLIVAGLLIALGTSLKLPLSTTYVTFIVAMGTSLSDRAWGRDNAVYRISGVLNVIGGWFITAIAAFMLTFVVAILIYYGGPVAIILLIALVVFMLIRNQKMFKRREKRHLERDTVVKLMNNGNTETALNLLQTYVREDIEKTMQFVKDNYLKTIHGFCKENLSALRHVHADIVEEKILVKKMKRFGSVSIRKLSENEAAEKGMYYFQCNDFMSELVYSLHRIVMPAKDHLDHNFKPFNYIQITKITDFAAKLADYITLCDNFIRDNETATIDEIVETGRYLNNELTELKRAQIRFLKEEGDSTKASEIYLTMIHESRNIISFSANLSKVSRKFFAGL